MNMALFFRTELPDGIKAPVGSAWNGLPGIVGSGPDVVEVDFQTSEKRFLTKWGITKMS